MVDKTSSEESPVDVALDQFGVRVRNRRKTLGLTQENAAEKAGLEQSHWSKVERGAVDPSLGVVLRIQLALEAPSLESFFGPFPSAQAMEKESRDSEA